MFASCLKALVSLITLPCLNVHVKFYKNSVLIADESVHVWWRFRHAITVVRADVLRGVCDSSEYSWLSVVLGTDVVSWTLADGVSVDFVDLFVSPPSAKELAGFFTGTAEPLEKKQLNF